MPQVAEMKPSVNTTLLDFGQNCLTLLFTKKGEKSISQKRLTAQGVPKIDTHIKLNNERNL